MNRRGFALIEVIVVVAILLILMSIIAPVVVEAKQAAKETKSKGNLSQIYVGLTLYREANNQKVDFGSAVDMGLPPAMGWTSAYLSVVNNRDTWKSPCCCHFSAATGSPSYQSYYIDYADFFHTEDLWDRYVRRWEDKAVLVTDFHCNDRSVDLMLPGDELVKGLGVRLGGSVEKRQRQVPASDHEAFRNW